MLHNLFKSSKKPVGAGRRNDGRRLFHFRCPESGSYPVDYEFTGFMVKILEKIQTEINQRVNQGMVDEYTAPEIFNEYIEAHLQLMRNDIEKQASKHGMAIGNIESEIRTALRMNWAYKQLGEEMLDEHENSIQSEKEEERYE